MKNISVATNPKQYGDLPLSVVQRVTEYIYQTKTYIDSTENLVVIDRRSKGIVLFKPISNPRHVVEVIHRILEDTNIDLSRLSNGNYNFRVQIPELADPTKNMLKESTGKLIYMSKQFSGNTIWEAAVQLILNQ